MLTLKRMFMTSGDVRRAWTARYYPAPADLKVLLHLVLPSGTSMFPQSYIDTLLKVAPHMAVTRDALQQFHASSAGIRAISQAQDEFTERLGALAAANPCPNLLTVEGVAQLLSVTRSAVESWYRSGLLPTAKTDGHITVDPVYLLTSCQWHPRT